MRSTKAINLIIKMNLSFYHYTSSCQDEKNQYNPRKLDIIIDILHKMDLQYCWKPCSFFQPSTVEMYVIISKHMHVIVHSVENNI